MDTLFDTITQPLDDPMPCGPALDNDDGLYALVTELEANLYGQPERQTGSGIIAAKEPNFRQAGQLCQQLLAKTKDIRIIIDLIHAQIGLHLQSPVLALQALTQGLVCLQRCLQAYWQDLHPQLVDEDGDADPGFRLNAFNQLAGDGLVQQLMQIRVVSSRVMGQFTFSQYFSAKQQQDETLLTQIHAAVAQSLTDTTGLDAFHALRNQVAQAQDSLAAIEQHVQAEIADALTELDLKPLFKVLQQIDHWLAQQAQANALNSDADAASPEITQEDAQVSESHPSALGVGSAIRSREDVVRQLDAICNYYRRVEPSSPVPLLLQRAKKLASMDFWAVINNISPDTLKQIEQLAGQTFAEHTGAP